MPLPPSLRRLLVDPEFVKKLFDSSLKELEKVERVDDVDDVAVVVDRRFNKQVRRDGAAQLDGGPVRRVLQRW